MLRLVLMVLALFIAGPVEAKKPKSYAPKTVVVQPHVKKNGKIVRGHYRSAPEKK